MHNNPPPRLENSQQILDAIEAINGQMVENLHFPRELKQAAWAAEQDEELGLSLICHYGWARSAKPDTIPAFALYKMKIMPDGILVDMEYAHTFQERFMEACHSVYLQHGIIRARHLTPSFAELQ